MAKLPKIEIKALWAQDELHRGNREKALAYLAEAGDGPLARELREATKKRGRQPFGASHLWWDIGIDNDVMRQAGKSYAERLKELSRTYRIYDEAKLKTAIAKYERAADELHALEEENR
tara:strand:+ start:6863 stop:7219 length:357 start_codon:yes stop_codon:yes gene_type:complete